jgi:CubicO group peptidase (beta-lactamase class C family)
LTRTLCGTAVLAALGLALLLGLWLEPPQLLRIGANYAAKMVCSNVFLAGRDPDEVLRDDVQAPGAALLRLMRVSVDREHGIVRAGLGGFIGDGLAVARPGVGCAVLPPGWPHEPWRTAVASAKNVPNRQPWPAGDDAEPEAALERIIADDGLTGLGTRAVLVVHRGHLVAERYGAGFGPRTRQLGWSLTKTVTAALIGIQIEAGRLALAQPAGWPADDARGAVRIADLLSMSSGLHFNEGYGAISDVTRMLFLEPDMAAFVRAQPLEHPVGSVWSYSSGSAVLLAQLVQQSAGPTARDFAHDRLFAPLGMTSALIETDAHGTPVGSSYMYATARDWARYGQFLLQDGMWQGRQLLPPGYVAMLHAPGAASRGQYGQGPVWLWGSDPTTPGENPDTAYGIPPDTYWMEGHDGQFIAIIPSRALVVVRLGLTPARLNFRPQPLLRALLDSLDQT